ncbi:MAG: DNA-protecting protein DprA [Symploca sp. SIO2G7]|nr:DNA-protecting protein DprA [Symploca sp. SIO2G7]
MERAYWLAWSHIKDVGPILIKRLHEQFGSLALAWQAEPADLLTVEGIGLVTAAQIQELRSHINPEHLLEQHETQYPRFWTPADADYPSLLWEIPDPPAVLYYRGPLRPNHTSTITVSIVGTRRPSPYGRRWTQRLSRHLSQQEFTIVSGMAAGIDAYAHQSCIAVQGQTIAVLGTGVDVIYPRSNARLYQSILETGLILSEYPDGVSPDRSHFPRRNRIIAGLSHATLVTEAPERSGALITAYLANDYGRQVYTLPDGLDNPTARGCLTLIDTGATVVMGEKYLVTDLLAMTNRENTISDGHHTYETKNAGVDDSVLSQETHPPRPESTSTSDVELDETLRYIFQMMPNKPVSLDNLAKTTQLDTSDLLSGLLQLEVAEVIVRLPGGQYQRS